MVSLVTGGAGFIGWHLAKALSERGEAVRILDVNNPTDLPPTVETICGDATNRDVIRRALSGVRTVFHLAGHTHLWLRDKQGFHRVNVLGTRVLLSECAKAGIERVVYTSSSTTLIGKDYRSSTTKVDERTRLGVDDMLGPYCRSKLIAEQEALSWAKRGLPVVVVIPTIPIGPGDRNLTPPSRMILDFLNGRTPAFLNAMLNMIDVRDIADGHIAACEKGMVGERYILGNHNLWIAQLLDILRELTQLTMPRRRVPRTLAYLVGMLSEGWADAVSGRPPKAPLTGVRLAQFPVAFDSTKAVSELGLPQSSIREALLDQILWLRSRGLVTRPLSLQSAQDTGLVGPHHRRVLSGGR